VGSRSSRSKGCARLVVFMALVSLGGGAISCAAEPTSAKNILLLYSFSDPTVYAPADSLKSAIRNRISVPVDFYVEYLESQRFENAGYERNLAQAMRVAYEGKKLDVVIAFSYPALEFAVAYRQTIFPGVPIVFADVNAARLEDRPAWPGVTGITINTDVRGTIDLALLLHPDTESIAVITNDSPFERYWLGRVHKELVRYQGRVKEIDLVGPANAELLARVAGLPPNTIALFQLAPQESSQPVISVYDTLAAIGQRLPTYCIFPTLCVNHGGIGGTSSDEKEQSAGVAELARRILHGEPPDSIPVMHGSVAKNVVDWRQLRRWRIPDSALPAGTLVMYREPTLWERSKSYIIAAIAVILAQSLLIAGLLWQRARKRKAEAVLRESEQRFRVMADSTPSLIWMCDEKANITYLNDKRVAFKANDGADGYGDTWKSYVHPDDLQTVLLINRKALQTQKSFSKEYRLLRRDGVYRWMFDVASPRLNGDGSFAGFIGSAIDVTEQKIAQEALEKVSGQLIEAQEKERTRIARELHDDICQRLALLSMELEQANRDRGYQDTKQRLQDIRQHCSEIADDVQLLSHQLHSSKLDYLGIVAAIKGFCREFAKRHNADIEFTDQNVPADLPREVSLCLFRITQEALHNALKYSGTSQCGVSLSGSKDEIRLVVQDYGAGFDVENARMGGGLGLVSMQERANLVRGAFHVRSSPGKGTTVSVTVPLSAKPLEFPAETPVDDSADAAKAG